MSRTPKQTHNNYTNFNHTTHIDRGYDCMTCHTEMSSGASDIVPKNKCYSCHNIRKEWINTMTSNSCTTNHVTNNKIACYQCHPNVKHEPKIKTNLCATCHSNEHPKDWLTTHKKEVLIGKICSDCHQPKFCSDCHAEIVTGRKKI